MRKGVSSSWFVLLLVARVILILVYFAQFDHPTNLQIAQSRTSSEFRGRDASHSMSIAKRSILPISTLAQAKVTRNITESVCGVAGRENDPQHAFQCIDTESSLENCGGCATPHPFYEPRRVTLEGVECGRLPGVVLAQCKQSQCVVSRYKTGLVLNSEKTKCVALAEPPAVNGGVRMVLHLNHKREVGEIAEAPDATEAVDGDIKDEILVLEATVAKLQQEAAGALLAPVTGRKAGDHVTLTGGARPWALSLLPARAMIALDSVNAIVITNAELTTALGPLSTTSVADLAGLLGNLDAVGQLALELQVYLSAAPSPLDLRLGSDHARADLVRAQVTLSDAVG
ncbi:hypothetical protein DXG01_005441 [Tephrocybe rancida]|nr:hypothetical protein DXG01_005441 [Tephrocybe rancida]